MDFLFLLCMKKKNIQESQTWLAKTKTSTTKTAVIPTASPAKLYLEDFLLQQKLTLKFVTPCMLGAEISW